MDEYGATSLLDAAEVNRRVRGTTERRLIVAFEMTGGDIGEPESAESGQPHGIDQSIGTRPRRHANACHRVEWSDVYELSKKLHREANSAGLRGTPILIGSPQRGHFQVRLARRSPSSTSGALPAQCWRTLREARVVAAQEQQNRK